MSRLRAFILVAALGVSTGLSGCVAQEASGELSLTPTVVESVDRFRKQYILAPGDAVDVIVRRNLEVTRNCVVRPDGYITLPLIDDVKAAGLTLPQLDEVLTERLSVRLVDPEVTVIATTVREPVVYVVGQVLNPTPVAHRSAATAAQAIAHAGGFTRNAAKEAVALIRLTDEGRLRAYVIPVQVQGQPGPYLALQATPLEPDDLLFVPQNDISQIGDWVDDYINRPLSGVNTLLAPVANFLLIKELIEDDD
jgi:polysaccharide export outer membrane protein